MVLKLGLVGVPMVPHADWYFLVPAGFSYIDEVCNTYIRALYDLDRDRDRIKSGLVLADKATSAIMGATGASTKAIQIAAQVFGLATNGTDVFVDRYEFKVEPAIVFLTLEKFRVQFRSDVASLSDTIRSPGQVMVVLRKYLLLCQPTSIEAAINGYVASAEVKSNITVSRAELGPNRSGSPESLRSRPVATTARTRDAGGIRLFLTAPTR